MRYVTISELNDMIRKSMWKIPHDIDLVVGIPRSGLLVANIVALYLNKRLTDVDSFAEGKIYDVGDSRRDTIQITTIRKVLIVDDSVGSGRSIFKAKEKIDALTGDYEFVFFSPIVTTIGKTVVDIYSEVIDEKRIFEWNLFHHAFISNACLDMDGVLCCDPPVDDDGEQYIKYISDAVPLFIPTVEIDTIVTCRLEKYRGITEQWLAKHNILYKNLIMLDFPSKEKRLQWGKHGEFKGEYYKTSHCNLFIESSYAQAYTIAKVSNKDVICIENNTLIHIEQEFEIKKAKQGLKKIFPRLYKKAKRIYNNITT